jgi:RNA polymerase sigma factor (TIGR02999 family)
MAIVRGITGRMSDSHLGEVTALLSAWQRGDTAARDTLMDLVYDQLRRLARAYLRRERPDHSLTPSALVHEAYLRLVDQKHVDWRNRAHFFSMASHMMRRILVDHARAHAAAKRGDDMKVSLDESEVAVDSPSVDILALNRALDKLAAVDARQSRLVELRFFGGLTVDEVAAVLDIAPITVKRDWALARAWLFRELRQES